LANSGSGRGVLVARRSTLALAAVVFALLVGEATCRVLVARENRGSWDMAIRSPRDAAPTRRVALIDILQSSEDERIIFELKPHMEKMLYKDAPVSTNRFGFRGPDIEPTEGLDTITIVGLGDSVMFGYGVPDGADYISMLERRLRQRHPQKSWRCINTAVPAYNTAMEVETLKTKGLQFGPDLVILGLVPNDLVLPPYIRVVTDVWDLRRSFLLERVGCWLKGLPSRASLGRDPHLLHRKSPEGMSAPVPEKYEGLQGWPAFLAALDELDALSKEHGFEVVFFTNTEDEAAMTMIQAAKKLGWPHARLLPDIQKYLKHHGGGSWDAEHPEAYLASALAVKPDDGHPSVLQHRMAADRILAELERSGVLERLLE